MRKCQQCQNPVDEDALFCNKCGCKLEIENKKQDSVTEEKKEKIFCSECGAKNESTSEYCMSCGVPLVKEKKKEKKARFIIKKVVFLIMAVLLLVLGVVLFVSKGGNDTYIEVAGEKYTFSAENGIDHYEKINNGVVHPNGLSYKYVELGSLQETYVDTNDYIAYVGSPARYVEIDNYRIAGQSFIFTDNFKSIGGVTESSNVAQLDSKGYKEAFGAYVLFSTEQGILDWNEIEQEYEQAKADGYFYNLPYYYCLQKVLPDMLRVSDAFSDIEAALRYSYDEEETKATIMYYLAYSKLCDYYIKGEIDYFCCSHIYIGNKNMLDLHVFSSRENVGNWMQNWKNGN